MVGAISRVSEQMQALDEAHSAAEAALRDSEQACSWRQSMAKVASWSGQPLEGLFRVHRRGGTTSTRCSNMSKPGTSC